MRTIIILGLGLVLLYSCDPVKRSIKRKERIDALIQDYLDANPPKGDTVYLKGDLEFDTDTIVYENIYVDTIRVTDTVWINQTRYRELLKTIRVVDTLVYRSHSSTGVSNAQYMRITEELKAAKRSKNTYLGALVILIGLCLLMIAYRFFN